MYFMYLLLHQHLFSVKSFTQNAPNNGILFLGNNATLLIQQDSQISCIQLLTTGKFYTLSTIDSSESNLVEPTISNMELLHYWLGYTPINIILQLSKSVLGLSSIWRFWWQMLWTLFCWKWHRFKFPITSISDRKSYKKLELIHSDICGPFTSIISRRWNLYHLFHLTYCNKNFSMLSNEEKVWCTQLL